MASFLFLVIDRCGLSNLPHDDELTVVTFADTQTAEPSKEDEGSLGFFSVHFGKFSAALLQSADAPIARIIEVTLQGAPSKPREVGDVR